MLRLRFASQIWSDRVGEKFGTAAKGQERRCRHKWKVLGQDKGYEVSNGSRQPRSQDSNAAIGVTHSRTVVPRRNRDGVCPLGVQSCQAEPCWIPDGSLLGLTGSLPKSLHVWASVSWGDGLPSLPASKKPFPWKPYRITGKFRSEETAGHLVQPLAQSRVRDEDNPLLVSEMRSHLKLSAWERVMNLL